MALTRHQKFQAAPAHIRRQLHLDLERTDGYQLVDRRAPSTRADQVDDVQDDPSRLLVQVAIAQPAALDCERYITARSPARQVREQVAVIRKIVSPETAIDVRRHIRDSPFGGVQNQPWYVR